MRQNQFYLETTKHLCCYKIKFICSQNWHYSLFPPWNQTHNTCVTVSLSNTTRRYEQSWSQKARFQNRTNQHRISKVGTKISQNQDWNLLVFVAGVAKYWLPKPWYSKVKENQQHEARKAAEFGCVIRLGRQCIWMQYKYCVNHLSKMN